MNDIESDSQEKSGDLRSRAERMLQGNGQGVPLSRPEEQDAVLHELEVQRIELQLQNEELLRTQQELRQAKEDYFALYELAPVGYITLNGKMLITRANPAAAQMLRTERRFLLNS